jgi:spore coat protein CotF
MMQEREMVSDALNSINSGLKTYTDMISQTENIELRSALQQMRNEAEKSQYELYTLAKSLHYYQPAQKASQDEVNNIKSVFAERVKMVANPSMNANSGMNGETVRV